MANEVILSGAVEVGGEGDSSSSTSNLSMELAEPVAPIEPVHPGQTNLPEPTEPTPTVPTRKVSKIFDFADADITLQSADNVLYRVHQQNLSAGCRAFRDMFVAARGDGGQPVPLTEKSGALKRFLSFFYDDLHPDVDTWTLKETLEAAELARKYQAAGVRQILRFRMAFELQKVRAARVTKESAKDKINVDQKVILSIFSLAHFYQDASLADSAAMLLLAVNPFAKKPHGDWIDDPAWHALRSFLIGRRGAVAYAISQFGDAHIFCIQGLTKLHRAVPTLHVDPSVSLPTHCGDYCSQKCSKGFAAVREKLQESLPTRVYGVYSSDSTA